MRLHYAISGLFLLFGGTNGFVYSCEEVKYKMMNSNFEVRAIHACLFVQEGYSSWSQLDKIYTTEDNLWTSFSWIANTTCVAARGDGSWRITSDHPFTLDCTQEFSLIFTSSISPSFYPLALRSTTAVYIDGGDGVFISPTTGIEGGFQSGTCTGSGNITIFTGAGSGEAEQRYKMASWKCADLPQWIVLFDNVNTIVVDDGTRVWFDSFVNDYTASAWLRSGDHVVVMASGRSDNLYNLHPERNVAAFQGYNDMSVGWQGKSMSFDGAFNSYLMMRWNLNGEQATKLGNGSYTQRDFDAKTFQVEFVMDPAAPEDLGNNLDNFVMEFFISDYVAPPTTAAPSSTVAPTIDSDPYCGCALDKKFGMPEGWDSTEVWVDVVIILDTSEAMGDVALVDASSLIESFIGTDDGDVLITDTNANYYTRIGLIAMSDKAEVIYNLNMTKADKVTGKVQITKELKQIDVLTAFNAALFMFADGLKSQPDRANTRQVIYYMTDSDPIFDSRPLDGFKASQGKIIVNDFLEPGDVPRPGLKDLASDGYYFTDIQYNYMSSIQLFCKANCYCRPDKNRYPYAGHSTDPAVNAAGGCLRVVPSGIPYSKMKADCEEGSIVSIHDTDKAAFVTKQFTSAIPKSDYFWIGYYKSENGWAWEDNSTNPYTNWDTANGEPSSNSVAKCAYLDTTSSDLFWGAGNCNVGFPSVCEYEPCAAGNKNC